MCAACLIGFMETVSL